MRLDDRRPKIFTAPWTQEFEILAKPEWDKDGLFEYVAKRTTGVPAASAPKVGRGR